MSVRLSVGRCTSSRSVACPAAVPVASARATTTINPLITALLSLAWTTYKKHEGFRNRESGKPRLRAAARASRPPERRAGLLGTTRDDRRRFAGQGGARAG